MKILMNIKKEILIRKLLDAKISPEEFDELTSMID